MAIEILILVLAITFSSVGIGGWALILLVRTMFRGISGCSPGRSTQFTNVAGHCHRDGCGQGNPAEARFCRRCGGRLAVVNRRQHRHRVRRIVRHAATW